MLKYALIVENTDGTMEVYGPFTTNSVELRYEQAKELGWVNRVLIAPLFSATRFVDDYKHSKGSLWQ